jgi:dTDP-4-dehydrorhamnose 3,5-epimerase
VEVRDTTLRDVKLLRSRPHADHRGFFARTSDADVLASAGIDHRDFVQESQSRSLYRVLRALHGRRELTEAKLLRCAHGAVFDVVVDLRPWSETFLQWESFVLDDVELAQLYIPPGCVNGFQAISEVADLCYRMDARYAPGKDLTIRYDDPAFGIPWPLEDPIVSERDRAAIPLAEVLPQLESYFGAAPPAAERAPAAGR